jgi:hypothetical protein
MTNESSRQPNSRSPAAERDPTTPSHHGTDEPAGDSAVGPADDDAATDDAATPDELKEQLARLRAEYEVLERHVAETSKHKARRRPTRNWASVACLVLGGLLLPFAVLSRWASDTMLDTDTYVETVTPLAENEDIQEALAFRVSETIMAEIDFRPQAEEALPEGAGFLAVPIESGVRAVVQDVVDALISTPAFERLWEDVNRFGHDKVVAVLTGDGNDAIDTADGTIAVRIGPIVEEVLDGVDDTLGTDLRAEVPDESLDAEFVLFESQELADLQNEIKRFDRWSWLMPILTIALFAAALVLASPRLRGLRGLGIAIAVPMAIALLLLEWVRSQYIGALPADLHNPDAAVAFFDITTRVLPVNLFVLLLFGAALWLLGWLFGPTDRAHRVRSWSTALVARSDDGSEEIGPVPKWVAANERTLLVSEVALGVVTLVLWTHPTSPVVLTVTVVVLLLMAATSVLAAAGRRGAPNDVTTSTSTSAGSPSDTPVSAGGSSGRSAADGSPASE